MHFDKEYIIELEDMMKNSVRNSFRRCLPGLHDDPTLDFVSLSRSPSKHLLTRLVTKYTILLCMFKRLSTQSLKVKYFCRLIHDIKIHLALFPVKY